jgi:hypothetical protein
MYRLQDETARVEDQLSRPDALEALLKCFVIAKANSFENLLDPFLKICRISNAVSIGMAKSQFFKRVIDRLNHSKAVVRLNLLRIVRAVCEVHPNRTILVEKYGIYEIVSRLSKEDGAVLVRELAREILPTLAPALKPILGNRSGLKDGGAGVVVGTPKYKKKARRTASESLPSMRLPVQPATVSSSSGSPLTRAIGNENGSKPRGPRQRLNEIPWPQSENGGGG